MTTYDPSTHQDVVSLDGFTPGGIVSATTKLQRVISTAGASTVRDWIDAAPETHTHAQSDITGLVSDLAGKQDASAVLTTLAGATAAGLALMDDANAAAQRATLGLVIGTDVQAYDTELAAIAGLTSAADKVPYFTGSGTAAVADFTASGRAMVAASTGVAQAQLVGRYETRTAAAAATIAAAFNVVQTLGYATAGDGGGATYKRVGSEPSHAGKFQSADGAWWEIAEPFYDTRMFGAKLDGTTNDTTATQNALDAAFLGPKVVKFGKGYTQISQIAVPQGVRLEGAGIGSYGLSPTIDITVLRQIAGTNDDMIIFKETSSYGGIERINSQVFKQMILLGDSSASAGYGISFRIAGDRTLDATHALIAGNSVFEELAVRGFRDGGIYNRRGCSGPTSFRQCSFHFNGGYGIEWIGINNSDIPNFDSIELVGNRALAGIYLASASSNQSFMISNILAEYRDNSAYGATAGGYTGAQPRAFQLGDFGDDCTVTVINAEIHTTVTEGPDCILAIDSTTDADIPNIAMIGCNVAAGTGGNNLLFRDLRNAIDVAEGKTLFYSPSGRDAAVAFAGGRQVVFGGDGSSVSSLGDAEVAVRGNLPGVVLREDDAAADAKTWGWFASGGELSLRSLTDAGSANIALKATRSGGSVSLIQFEKAVRCVGSFGYTTGAGSTVTQGTSRTTGVTINALNGEITLVSAAGSATPQSFTVTNSSVAASDRIICHQKSGTDIYVVMITAVSAGSFRVTYYTTGGTTTEQPVFSFAVIKGSVS